MRFWDYIKDRSLFLLANVILFAILTGILALFAVEGPILILLFTIWFIPLTSFIVLEYVKQRRFFDESAAILENLENAYLLTEVLEEPDHIEGKLTFAILRQANKDMHEQVKKYRDMENEYREYIETWVHEIKTPIASGRLIIANNPNESTRLLYDEMTKIENYIDQVLYYARSNHVGHDHLIRAIDLSELVKRVIKRNARSFIGRKIAVNIERVEGTVYSDAKWLEFILNQVIGNAIKYSERSDSLVRIYTNDHEHRKILSIEDNGMGIPAGDIDRLFEKGFTGENGRKFSQSTGIGLYLCKKLANQLGLGLTISSVVNKGTQVNIVFPLGDAGLLS